MSLEWAKHEADRLIKKLVETEDNASIQYTKMCLDSALKAYELLIKCCHSGNSWNMTKNYLMRLMEMKSLVPIEDLPENWGDPVDRAGTKQYQSIIAPGLFKAVHTDGKVTYYDLDRVVFKDKHTGVVSCNGYSRRLVDAMFPISMPYMPSSKPYVVVGYTFNSHDGLVGSYDTVVLHKVIAPEGSTKMLKFAIDGDTGDRITHKEYRKRWLKYKELVEKEKHHAD